MTYRPSDPRHDNRPLPPEIYQRRRIAALVILLVVVGLVIWGLTAFARSGSGPDDSEEAPAQTTENITTEPTVQAPADATGNDEPVQDEPAATTAAEPGEEPANNAGAKDTCVLEDLRITARTNSPSYGPGEQPAFYMTVDNPTAADCVIDLTEEQLRFEVYDMATNQRIWSDTDCHPPVVTGEETFAPGEPRDFEAVWSRKDSRPGECADRQDVPDGSYYLHAVIGAHASDPVDFTLRP
ncbi:hypothetical protein [Corynebacterium timonense]|uniref:Intracellular proteinase inhibitor n=1 Tax=Corynebacterium timonense TaxID=441500 RepID=A0A1H1L741_9CORY|nr:hypothetical protein [Corynebacterium timonense]SDR70122.1 hypothetical protein SAMN04488539_0083 [Corynebacterium timonense]